MSVRSMTGFARARKVIEQGEVILSLKAVNHRGLDLHFHLPPEFDAIEGDIRAVLKKGLARGHVQIHVAITRTGAAVGGSLNKPLMEAYVRAFREAAEAYNIAGELDLNAALRVPGMLNAEGEDVDESFRIAVLDAAAEAVESLNEFREREGGAIAREMRDRTRDICELVSRIEGIRAGAVPAFHKRLREKMADLLKGVGIDPQRMAQEAALIADRSDIAEELVRLRTHAAQLDQLLAGNGEVGKKLDFLLQEMNRETNTVLSKTGGLGDLGLTITELALAVKSEIDKIREQSLNVE